MSPFAPDRKHLHHRLLDIGHSHRSSVLIMYLWAALFSGTVVGLSITKTPLFVLAVATAAAVLALLLMSMPRLRWWERRRPARCRAPPTPARSRQPARRSPGPASAAAARLTRTAPLTWYRAALLPRGWVGRCSL